MTPHVVASEREHTQYVDISDALEEGHGRPYLLTVPQDAPIAEVFKITEQLAQRLDSVETHAGNLLNQHCAALRKLEGKINRPDVEGKDAESKNAEQSARCPPGQVGHAVLGPMLAHHAAPPAADTAVDMTDTSPSDRACLFEDGACAGAEEQDTALDAELLPQQPVGSADGLKLPPSRDDAGLCLDGQVCGVGSGVAEAYETSALRVEQAVCEVALSRKPPEVEQALLRVGQAQEWRSDGIRTADGREDLGTAHSD